MPTPMLSTKLYIPPVRPELVSHALLVERINVGVNYNITHNAATADTNQII